MIVILGIGPDDLQKRLLLPVKLSQSLLRGGCVVNGSTRHRDRHQQAQRFHAQVALPAVIFLPPSQPR